MNIRIGYDISFQTTANLPMNLALYTHPSREPHLVYPDLIHVQPEYGPELPVQIARDSFGNKIGRIVSPGGRIRIWSENVIRDSGRPDPVPSNDAEGFQAPPDQLPPGWGRARAVVDWVHDYVTFGYQFARCTKTAMDVWHERRGVCRDFQHLCVTLHRALNLPARYVTGYLGDIGVPFNPAPVDFSAWHEVYLGGRWWALDGRHNVPRIGRILMATGRDAVDVALTTQFGSGWLQSFQVVTEEVREGGPKNEVYQGPPNMTLFANTGCGAQVFAATG